jgi:iron complex transport system substrate-binding protein
MRRFSVWVVACAVAAAACGGGAEVASTTSTATTATSTIEAARTPATATVVLGFPVLVASQAGQVRIEARPQRIAALAGTFVEMLFALGAGDQVIAGDLFTNYPPDAADLVLVDSFNLNVEAVIELDPDLVVLSFDPGDAVAAFEAVGIPTLLFTTAPDLEAVYDQISVLGAATGHAAEAAALVEEMATEIKGIVAAAGGSDGMTYYHETDPASHYSPNGSSFLGQLYGLLGMQSIADAAPDEFGSGFPLLSAEFIVESDPDVILIGGGGATASELAARPGWDTMTAVQQGRIVELDADLASRWGPRVVDLLRTIAESVVGAER